MIQKFVNRKEELNFLEERYKNKNFEFFVIYGRRRVGKTELIKTFLKGKEHIYFLCDKSGTERNARRFKKSIAEFLKEPIIESNDLEEIFSYLTEKVKDKIIIVFDEFSYLTEKDSAISSVFQVICDEILKKKNIFLILCGSSISMMEEGVLSQKSPLYGRKTAHIKLLPIKFKYFKEFFPLNEIEKNIEFYSILDGIPFYLEKFNDKKSLPRNINEQMLIKKGQFYEEIDFLLKEELREPDIYKTILDAIASGKTKVVEIANGSRIKVQDIDKYLKTLIRLGIIKKENPVTEVKSKKSIYLIDDNFFNFSFLFLEPNKSKIEIGEIKSIEEKIKIEFSAFVGKKFERLIKNEVLPLINVIEIQKIGKWWGHKKENKERKAIEIDVVALNEKNKEILFCECKWKEKVNIVEIIKELAEKSKYVNWYNETRKESYAIFAKSFDKKIKEFNEKKVYCFDLDDIKSILE
ncbi:MAG: ATP-binding protein [Nanoarchaeota archaeon]